MQSIHYKYGNELKELLLNSNFSIDIIQTNIFTPTANNIFSEVNIIDELSNFFKTKQKPINQIRVGIAINDKTRPIPYSELLPLLLDVLSNSGITETQIHFFIANGTHVPDYEPFSTFLLNNILNRYKYYQHNCLDDENLIYLGETTRNTKVLFNKEFYNCDLKISIGNIEPHHFAGFSGGYKTVAIGLAGKQTINENHKLLLDPKSVAGVYYGNPVRMDINEIGRLAGLNYCLNCIMNEHKEIVSIIFGKPDYVMEIGIPIVKSIYMVEVPKKYDFVIASAGGFPKDINFYQSQKALTNAAKICCDGGTIILLAECREGIGSDIFEDYMKTFSNPIDIISDFVRSPFQIGKHKAYLVARFLSNHHIAIHSSLGESKTNLLLLEYLSDPMIYFDNLITPESTIAFIPDAVVTVPNSQG